MPRILGNLSYRTQQALPIFRPVDDYAALFKKKDEDYNYVIEGKHTIDNILAQMPSIDKDKHIVEGAKNKVDSVFKDWSEKGDFENRIIDIKNLANNIATKQGLVEVQRNARARSEFITTQQERLAKGEIFPEDFNRALADADTKYTGVQQDPTTGSFTGSYNPRTVLKAFNPAEKIGKALEGFKANGFILDPNTGEPVDLTNGTGERIVRNPDGSGYMTAISKKEVTEGELARAISSFVANDPEYQAKVQDDLYYELDSILYDRETGQRREMSVGDLERLIGTKVTKEVATKFGLDSIENLQENLESRGYSVEDLYKQIRSDQMLNSAAQFGLAKESYVDYDAQYFKDWMLESGSGASSTVGSYGFLDTWVTTETYTSEDTERVSRELKKTDDALEIAENDLKNLNANPNTHSDDIDAKEKEVAKLKAAKNELGNRASAVIKESPEVTRAIDKLVLNDFGANEYFEQKGIYNYENRYQNDLGVEGLSINTGSARQLVYKALGNELTDTELQQYIKLDKNQELANSYRKWTDAGFSTASPRTNENYDLILKEGEKAFETINENNTIKNKVLSDYNSKLNTQTNLLRHHITGIADDLKSKIDEGAVPYNQDYTLAIIPPGLEAKAKRAHPFYLMNTALNEIPKVNANYYKQLSTSFTKETIPNAVQAELEKMEGFDANDAVENGRVDFSNATMFPSFDIVPDYETGEYNPSVLLKVPVKSNDGKNTTYVQIGVNNPNPSFKATYIESMVKFKDQLINKDRTVGLEPSEELLLDQANRALYNLSPYGKALDNLDLYNAKFGNDGKPAVIPFTYWDNRAINIEAYKYGSVQNMSFYLTDPKATDDAKYWAVKSDGTYGKVTNEQLRGSTWTALGGNDPQDLKYLFGKMVFESNAGSPNTTYKVPEKDLVDITSIFGNNIKEGVIPKVNRAVVDKVEVLKYQYPNLYITDSLRPISATYGEKESLHKSANALDFRTRDPQTGVINEDAIRLAKTPPHILKGMGIKQVIDEGDHIHVEFL